MNLKNNIFFAVTLALLFTSGKPVGKKSLTIHNKAITIDTHCDTPMKFVNKGFDIGKEHEAPNSRVDIPRMESGGLDAIFFAIFTSQRPRTSENYEKAYNLANQMIDSTYAAIKNYPNQVELATNSKDVTQISKKGKRAIYLGMENGFPLEKNIDRVEEFYNKGVRYITLSHSSNNDICDSSTDKNGPEHNGLSDFGIDVVNEMNRLGMIIDISHVSDKSFFDVMKVSKTPVIASHSSVRSICNHPRNMSDKMIKKLAEKGGVIQICILGAYIEEEDTTSINYIKHEELRKKYNNFNYKNEEERKAAWREWDRIDKDYPPVLPNIAKAVDHIDYVVNLVGIDHVGIGSDFDGGGGLSDCQDVGDFPKITDELLNRGYSKEDIYKIWGGNFLRVFKEVEDFALKN
ncbi:dipeptidase [Carboxylicivirga linearis]|uniref:Membrane dipeptidase n=1 Tax=Carboxylicivirga linearis TaxID=1628157 RepID=A0ABS5JVD5_9BACT|nr:dipeptidase [Carboxylicivirga linearis]MBS2098809.1 membrane dipeptidase [Carboxylicivirga linearis]